MYPHTRPSLTQMKTRLTEDLAHESQEDNWVILERFSETSVLILLVIQYTYSNTTFSFLGSTAKQREREAGQ